MTVTATVPTPPPNVTWLAGRDRVAHAATHRATKALCGEPAIVDERFAWPPFRKCMACRAQLEIPETEERLLHGDR